MPLLPLLLHLIFSFFWFIAGQLCVIGFSAILGIHISLMIKARQSREGHLITQYILRLGLLTILSIFLNGSMEIGADIVFRHAGIYFLIILLVMVIQVTWHWRTKDRLALVIAYASLAAGYLPTMLSEGHYRWSPITIATYFTFTAILMLMHYAPFGQYRQWREREYRLFNEHCPQCNYDLSHHRDSTFNCPECGIQMYRKILA